jgi:hypothetical protein
MAALKTSVHDLLKTEMAALKTSMHDSLKKVEKSLSRVQTNFGSVYEVMVRYEPTGFKLDDQTLPLVVEKLSDMFYFCSAFEDFNQEEALKKVTTHVETIFPAFFQSLVSGSLNRTDFERLLNPSASSCDKKDYLDECMVSCIDHFEKAKAAVATSATSTKAAQVKELKKNFEMWTHTKNALDCISNYYLRPDSARFDSSLGTMILLWNTDQKTILRSVEIGLRGKLEVGLLDSAGDTGADASSPPADSSVGVSDGGASSPPAKKISAYMGECKMSKRKRQIAMAQLTLRLKLLRSFLLAAGLATADKDCFVLEGRVYLPAGSKDPSERVATVNDDANKTVLTMRTIVSSICSFAADGASSGSEDGGVSDL